MPSETPSADASQADATDPDPEPEPSTQAGPESTSPASSASELTQPPAVPAVPADDAASAEAAPESLASSEAGAPALTHATRISDLIATAPDAARVLYEEFGLPCYRCPARYVETLAEGLSYHGLDPAHVLARLS